MGDRDEASFPHSEEYTVEEIVDHALFDDLYFRKLMYRKNHHPATDKIMGSFSAQIKKGEKFSKYVYRTRWAGYRPDEDTWEPEVNFWIPDDNGKIEANEFLIAYKEPLGLKGHQLSKSKFTSQTDAENLENFGLPAKIYEELNMRFEVWAKIKNKSNPNANVVQKPQMPSKLNEHKKKRSSLEMDSNESGTSAACCLKELRAQEPQATANVLPEVYGRVVSDSLSTSTEKDKQNAEKQKAKKAKLLTDNESDRTKKQSDNVEPFYWERPAQEQWVKNVARQKKEKEDSLRKSFAAINGSSSSSDEQPSNREPLKRNTLMEPQSTSEIETNSEVQQKKNLPTVSGDSVIELVQKDPIKRKIRIEPLEKVVTSRPIERTEKQTKDESRIRPKKPPVQNKRQQRRTIFLDSLPSDGEIAKQSPHFKKQPFPRLPQKTVEAENVINTVPKAPQKEDDILIIEEKSCEKNSLRNKKSQFVTGCFKFSMTPFLVMPYQRRRARSCGAAMTDGGVSFVKELEESYAKERRWNVLLKRGVRIDSTEQAYRIGKQIRLTQIRRDGVVRYACAEKDARDHLRKIGHVISKPVPLREIDMDLVEKNETNRKKKNVTEK